MKLVQPKPSIGSHGEFHLVIFINFWDNFLCGSNVHINNLLTCEMLKNTKTKHLDDRPSLSWWTASSAASPSVTRTLSGATCGGSTRRRARGRWNLVTLQSAVSLSHLAILQVRSVSRQECSLESLEPLIPRKRRQ